MGTKKILEKMDQKKSLDLKKNQVAKKTSVKKKLSNIFLALIIFCVGKNVGSEKKILVEKMLGPKTNFGSKIIFGPKNLLDRKEISV